ncbi:MAG: flagellin [Chloroflexi bacterium]|nr:flagellin [Chloroflexota bacterium]
MRINTNINALNVQRNLTSVNGGLSKSIERLSSGLRINRAADDAAGLSISEKLRGQSRGLNQAIRNAQDGISMIQTAEGGLNETHSILQRMRELAIQASNDTLTDIDRGAVASELTSLKNEIDRIANNTEFNTKKLLNGSLSTSLAGAAATDLVNNELIGTSGVVAQVNVAGAQSGTTFTMTAAGTTGVTLTATIGGQTVSQTIVLSSMTTAGTQSLNFNTLGVSISLSGGGANGTIANIQAELVGASNDTIVTSVGASSASFQVGANANQTVTVSMDSSVTSANNASAAGAFGFGGGFANLAAAVTTFASSSNTTNAQALIQSLDDAIADVSMNRSSLGAVQNRLEHSIENLATSAENLTASESRIRDADMAAEMVIFTRNNILSQAGTSILAQANQLPQGVLSLLK